MMTAATCRCSGTWQKLWRNCVMETHKKIIYPKPSWERHSTDFTETSFLFLWFWSSFPVLSLPAPSFWNAWLCNLSNEEGVNNFFLVCEINKLTILTPYKNDCVWRRWNLNSLKLEILCATTGKRGRKEWWGKGLFSCRKIGWHQHYEDIKWLKVIGCLR